VPAATFWKAGRLVWPSLLLVVVDAAWTISISSGGLWRVVAAGVPAVAAVGAAVLIRAGREGGSFAATAVAFGGTVAALFANLYPRVMVSSTSSADNLTVAGTASGDYALKVMTVAAAVVFPVVLLYQGWSYWVFRARLHTPPETVKRAS
jgi:cytochrome bd ubiquinol oxidase subunit II